MPHTLKIKLLEQVFEYISEAIVVINKNNEFVIANSKAQEMVGIKRYTLSPEEWAKSYTVYCDDRETICEWKDLPAVQALSGKLVERKKIWLKQTGEEQLGKMIVITAIPIFDDNEVIGAIMIHDENVEDDTLAAAQLRWISKSVRERIAKYQNV